MDNGLIHDKLDIKILLLFLLRRLPCEIESTMLYDLCASIDGIDYFDYSDCLHELVSDGLASENEDGFAITSKGSQNVIEVETGLPYTVRNKAMIQLEPVISFLQRYTKITAEYVSAGEGYKVKLKLDDGKGELCTLNLLCNDLTAAKRIRRNFRQNAEDYYNRFIEILSKEGS